MPAVRNPLTVCAAAVHIFLCIRRTPLVPVFGFGENDVFQQIPNPPGSRLRRFQNAMSKLLSFSPPLFHGRGFFSTNFGVLPYRRPIDVVGKNGKRFFFLNVDCTVFLMLSCHYLNAYDCMFGFSAIMRDIVIILDDDMFTVHQSNTV
jgi:hypothetical protein